MVYGFGALSGGEPIEVDTAGDRPAVVIPAVPGDGVSVLLGRALGKHLNEATGDGVDFDRDVISILGKPVGEGRLPRRRIREVCGSPHY